MDILNCGGCEKKLTDVVRYSYIYDRGNIITYCNVCLYTWCNECGGTDCKYRCIDCDAACDEECKCYGEEDMCENCGEEEEDCECKCSICGEEEADCECISTEE